MGVLDGRIALVAGASSGIGLATALSFAEAGANVHAAARRADMIEEAAGDRVAAHDARRHRPRRGRPRSRRS